MRVHNTPSLLFLRRQSVKMGSNTSYFRLWIFPSFVQIWILVTIIYFCSSCRCRRCCVKEFVCAYPWQLAVFRPLETLFQLCNDAAGKRKDARCYDKTLRSAFWQLVRNIYRFPERERSSFVWYDVNIVYVSRNDS